MQDCPKCKGLGKINTARDDEATGAKLKRLREFADLSLRSVAGLMKLSPTYISRLEHGRERWNPDLEKRYRDAVGGE